jgi:hypothetical protein
MPIKKVTTKKNAVIFLFLKASIFKNGIHANAASELL